MPRHALRIVAPLAVLAACSGSPETTSSTRGALSGPVDVRLVNAIAGDELPPVASAVEIVVTIARIDAKIDDSASPRDDDDGWTTLSTTSTTLDILASPGAGFRSLLVTKLPAGGLERLRLFVSPSGPNFVTTADGREHVLIAPSGAIDVVDAFDVESCGIGYVTLAFWGKKSILVQPLPDGSSTWFLRPIVRVQESVVIGAPCDENDGGRDRDLR